MFLKEPGKGAQFIGGELNYHGQVTSLEVPRVSGPAEMAKVLTVLRRETGRFGQPSQGRAVPAAEVAAVGSGG